MQIHRTLYLSLFAFFLLIGAALCFMPLWEGALWLPAVVFTGVGMLLVAGLVWVHSGQANHIQITPLPTESLSRADITVAALGIAMLVGVTALQFVPQVSERLQLVLLFGGMGAFLWGLAGLRITHLRNLYKAWMQTPRWAIYSLTGTFVGALAVRLWRLESGLRVLVDEMQNITPIVRMWEHNFPLLQQIYYPDYPYTYLYPYMQQVGSAIFGYNLFTLRLPNAVYGALSIFAVYWLVCLLFENRRLAVMSSIALAALPLHIQFSRIGIMNLYDPTLAMITFAFAIRGLRYGLRRDWVLAGAMLGFTHYVYEGGRLLHTPLLLLWLFLLMIWLWKRAEPLRVAKGLTWAVGVSIVLAAPIYVTWLGMEDVVFGRLQSQNLTKVELPTGFNAPDVTTYRSEQISNNFIDSFALYVTKLDEWMFYGGDQPMIPTFVQPFFLMGLAASLAYRKRWGYAMLPALWVLVTAALLGLFIWNPLHAARHTVAIPGMAIVIALGVYWLTKLLFRDHSRQAAAAWILIGGLALGQVVYYFGFHLPTYNYQARWVRGYADPDDAMLRAAELPHNTEVYVITREELFPRWHPEHMLQYITHNNLPIVHVWLQEWLWGDILSELTPGNNHAFFIEADNFELIQEIMDLHPDLIPSFSDDPYLVANQQFVLLYVPANQVLPRPSQTADADNES